MTEFSDPIIRRALITLYNKQGVLELAAVLQQQGVELISTGGTAQLLRGSGYLVTEIADYTKYPEMMGGRVKTLHPKIHGAILGRRGQDDSVMTEQEILPIDLVIANFYPFVQTIDDPNHTRQQAIEQIDIGGPTLVRAAAKNHAAVAVVVDPQDYPQLINWLQQQQGALTLQQRFMLASKALVTIANYDCAIADYFSRQVTVKIADDSQLAPLPQFPEIPRLPFQRPKLLRYGENPHQPAALYQAGLSTTIGVAQAQQQQGKPLSYNNWLDADSAFTCIFPFEQPACAIVKHTNPCGVAVSDSLLTAYQRAFQCDPSAAFGGIIAVNRPVTLEVAEAMLQQFVEVIIAPAFASEALQRFARKPNIRLLACDKILPASAPSLEYKSISGGLLVQVSDQGSWQSAQLQVVSQRQPSDSEWADAQFAWQIAKCVKSNAMVIASQQTTLGIGAGQVSRIDATQLAIHKAQQADLSLKGAVLAADAFLPFRDNVDTAAEAGITCIIQPGGSRRDAEVIQAADQRSITMIFTGMRHFRH